MNIARSSNKQIDQNINLKIDAMANKQSLNRNFSTQQLNSWIKSDQLTKQQEKPIYKLIQSLVR